MASSTILPKEFLFTVQYRVALFAICTGQASM